KRLSLRVAAPAAPVHVAGDPFLLQQAVSNLLDNAIDFSPEAGEIEVSIAVEGEQARARIINEGDGIPEYARERIFQRFYSLPRPQGGRKSTGLGLSFVKEVAELHGGTISIDNVGPCRVQATLSLP